MSLFQIALFSILLFFYVFIIVERICQCIEKCHAAKTFNEFIQDPEVKDNIVKAMTEGGNKKNG